MTSSCDRTGLAVQDPTIELHLVFAIRRALSIIPHCTPAKRLQSAKRGDLTGATTRPINTI